MELNLEYQPNVKDGVYYNGKHLPLCYEELCDLFARFRDTTTKDNPALEMTKDKAASVFGQLLPMTDY